MKPHQFEMKRLMEDDADDDDERERERERLQQRRRNMEENDYTWPKLKRNLTEFKPKGTKTRQLTSLFSDPNNNNNNKTSTNTNSSNGVPIDTRQRSRSFDSSSLHDLFEDVDAQNQFEAFLATIDRFEDEFDQQAYAELIPLNIRMALENQIFGWNHLYSAALGHVVLPCVAYTFTYWIVSVFALKGVSCKYTFSCTLHKVYHMDPENYIPILGMSFLTFTWIRIALGLWSALSAFRSIRRRRMVWLHHQATEYFKKDTVAEAEMKEADRGTLLGRIRNRVNRRRHNTLMRRIDKAERRFEKRANRRRREFHDGAAEYEHDHHRRVQMLSGKSSMSGASVSSSTSATAITGSKTAASSSSNSGASSNHRKRSPSSSPTNSGTYGTSQYFQYNDDEYRNQNEEKDSEHFINTYQRYRRTSIQKELGQLEQLESKIGGSGSGSGSPSGSALGSGSTSTSREEEGQHDHEHEHEDTMLSQTQFYGHTMPAFAMESIQKDQIRFQNGLLNNMAYAHGGFFGSAPFMLANPHWINILRTLMPDVYVQISRRVVHTPVPQLIHWAENNPVVAAYGTAHELEYCGKVPTLEWDVFLDPHLVSRVEVVLDARESFLNGLAEKSRRIEAIMRHKRAERRYTDRMDGIAVLLDSDERRILHFYNTEISKRVMILLERMLIAHGNLSQLAMEQTGHLKQYIFSRVKHTQRTLGGGICAKQWIMTFTEALKMSTERDDPFFGEEFASESGSSTPTKFAPGLSSSYHNNHDQQGLSSSPPRSLFAASSEDAPLLGGDESKEEDDQDLYAKLDGIASASASANTSNNYIRRRPNSSSNSHDRDTSPLNEIREDVEFTPPNSPRPSREGSPHSSPRGSPKTSTSASSSTTTTNMKRSTSFDDLAQAAVSTSSIGECMKTLKDIMKCSAPLGLILDIKSRHVPKGVWALLLEALRDMGVRVEGVATFYVEDIRDISRYCATPMNEIVFFHTAGDLQKACHDGRIRRGDSCFFNAGSLFWNFPDLTDKDFYIRLMKSVCSIKFNAEEHKRQYTFQPYARVVGRKSSRRKKGGIGNDQSSYASRNSSDDLLVLSDPDNFNTTEIKYEPGGGSTIQQYKEHFDLKIGLYVQEFAIDDYSMDLLVKYVNANSDLYAHGFSWGGVNGVTVRGIQPGRLTNTDGLWNQRYAGERWDRDLYPPGRIQ